MLNNWYPQLNWYVHKYPKNPVENWVLTQKHLSEFLSSRKDYCMCWSYQRLTVLAMTNTQQSAQSPGPASFLSPFNADSLWLVRHLFNLIPIYLCNSRIFLQSYYITQLTKEVLWDRKLSDSTLDCLTLCMFITSLMLINFKNHWISKFQNCYPLRYSLLNTLI